MIEEEYLANCISSDNFGDLKEAVWIEKEEKEEELRINEREEDGGRGEVEELRRNLERKQKEIEEKEQMIQKLLQKLENKEKGEIN